MTDEHPCPQRDSNTQSQQSTSYLDHTTNGLGSRPPGGFDSWSDHPSQKKKFSTFGFTTLGMHILKCKAGSAPYRRQHTPTFSYYIVSLQSWYLRHLCEKPALIEVSFRIDVRVDKIEPCVTFPALFNVGTGTAEFLSNQTRQAIYAQSKVKAHSRKNCCLGKAIIMTYSACVSVAFVIQDVKRNRHTIMSSVAWLAIAYFSKLSHKQHDFRKKGYWI
jgi:hypothetical protein